MDSSLLQIVPDPWQDKARRAIVSAFGNRPATSMRSVPGGASGALKYRVEVGDRPYLLRMETHRSPLRNPQQYACMKAAADAGIAPPIRYIDDEAGIAVIDFISTQPLGDFPGGAVALAQAIGALTSRLQATVPFPRLADYRLLVERLMTHVRRSSAPGLLDAHIEGLELIKQSLPWDEAEHRSSHNDPNPLNILFDGTRLWLIDWETAFRNDPLVDVAIVAENFAATAELEMALLTSWMGTTPDRMVIARLLLIRQLTRLYYAGLLLTAVGRTTDDSLMTDLAAPTTGEFHSLVASGVLVPGGSETKRVLGKMFLAGFLSTLPTDAFKESLAVARGA